MEGKSLDIAGDKLNRLQEILPEALTENKIDWEKFKATVADNIEFKNERYMLNGAGKSEQTIIQHASLQMKDAEFELKLFEDN